MTDVLQEDAGGTGRSPQREWCYISGRVTSLETDLLTRDFFEGVLELSDVSAARAAVAKTPYRAALLSDDAVLAYGESITAFGEKVRAEVLAKCPPHVMGRFLEMPRRYRVFRADFLRKSSFGDPPVQLAESFDLLGTDERAAEALSYHRSVIWERESPQKQDPVAQSLFLDSCVVTLMLSLARAAREKAVATLLRDRAILAAWGAVLRSRWSGTPSETLRRWFVLEEPFKDLAALTEAAAESDPANAVAGYLSRPAAAMLSAAGAESIRKDVDAAATEALREDVMDCRAVPFGPEKVVAYLSALEVQETNLRIALAAVVNGIDPKAASERLRREYV